MRRTLFTASALIAVALATSTAMAADAPAASAEDRFFDKVEAVSTASWPLLVEGADLCQIDTAYRTGLRHAYFNDPAGGKVGSRVTAIAKGSPADQAGIKRGDTIVKINGEKVEGLIPGRGGDRLDKLVNGAAESPDPVSFDLERDGKPVAITVTPKQVCDLKVEYVPFDSMLSPRTGDTVIVSDLLFNVTTTEWQRQAFLASDVAYAMSRTASKNTTVKKLTSLGGNLLGAVSGLGQLAAVTNIGTSLALNKGEALKADRVSLFLLARAGVDVNLVPDFWRAVYAYPESDKWNKTYFGLRPTLAERNEVFQKTLGEIKAIRESGQPLVPVNS